MVKIVVDSTADLRPEIRERVSVVSLTVRFGKEEYVDRRCIQHTGVRRGGYPCGTRRGRCGLLRKIIKCPPDGGHFSMEFLT